MNPDKTETNPIQDVIENELNKTTILREDPIWDELLYNLEKQPSEEELEAKEEAENAAVEAEVAKRFGDVPKQEVVNNVETNQEPASEDLENANKILIGGIEKYYDLPEGSLEYLMKAKNDFFKYGFNKDDDLTLRQEFQDRYDKFVNNKTDYSAPMTKKEQLTDKLVQKGFKKIFSAASDVYTDGMTDFSRARENPNAEVMQNIDTLDEETKKALLEYGVKPNERGVYYNADSEMSKKFANSPEVKKFFAENEESIRQGKKTGENFNFDFGIPREELDRYASLQHAKMISAYYDENGKKHGRFIDNVDYERRQPDSPKDLIKTYFNNHGYNMQEKGNFENYFIVMDILLDDSLNDIQKKSLLQKLGLKK